ncbi:hypothetical protein C1H46_036279 [Malus baccata]|uniref:C2 domain-containing protein n=1 Tax=Malus baccata TaxID=106549 RepID=A0A540KV95_MALBA|nr:hypothetical protein C1H46_036279 [Malus baccata]
MVSCTEINWYGFDCLILLICSESAIGVISYLRKSGTERLQLHRTEGNLLQDCKDLSAFNFFNKLSVHSAVSIFNDEAKKEKQKKHLQQRHKTLVDREGDCNPEWNHTMQFNMNDVCLVDEFDNSFVEFHMQCESVFGKKSIGKVRVPFVDLIDEQCNEAVRFVSYQVRSSLGKPNGVLNFSYKVIKDNNNSRVGICDSQESGSSSELTTASVSPDPAVNTVQSLYPALDVELLSRDINMSYPLLSGVRAPLRRISVPSPKFSCHWRPKPYDITWLPSLLLFSLPATGLKVAMGILLGTGQFGMVENSTGHDGWIS